MNIQFSGSAGYYPYILGLARGLQINNYSSKDFDKIYCYSSGATVALLFSLDIDIKFAMKTLHIDIELELNKSLVGTAFNFLNVLENNLISFLNNINTEIYKKANNKLHICLTKVSTNKYFIPDLSSEIINEYYSNEDLAKACIASGFISFYSKNPFNIFYNFRNMKCIDSAIKRKVDDSIFEINITRNMFRDKYNFYRLGFNHFIFIGRDNKKIKKMYNIGVLDSLLLISKNEKQLI